MSNPDHNKNIPMSEEMIEATPKNKKKPKKRGSSRSIETLFRNAYRTQLGLTSIADTKANIMISVNGFIITGIIATTGLFADFEGWYKYLPLLVLLNSVASMLFAVVAAKPKFSQSTAKPEDVRSGKASLLYFANFKNISEQDYKNSISKLIEEPHDVYMCMSGHIYHMGSVLSRKYRSLKYSYSIFLYGMIAISILFTSLFLSNATFSPRGIDQIQTMPFSSIYEPSGMVYVGEGEFLVVEDEPQRPFHKVQLDAQGRLRELGAIQPKGAPILLNDLEGITFDGTYIYAITSHSQTKSGDEGSSRMGLIRYEYQDGVLDKPRMVQDFKQAIISKLGPALPELTEFDIDKKINIEAMAWHPLSESLFIAFRAPLSEDKSLVLQLKNPGEIFERQTAAQANIALSWLSFNHNGIRAMSWDTQLNGFFMVTGRRNNFSGGHDLWKWAGNTDSVPIKISRKDYALPQGTEGLSTFDFADNRGMLIVVDDGNEELDIPGHYKVITLGVTPDATPADSGS